MHAGLRRHVHLPLTARVGVMPALSIGPEYFGRMLDLGRFDLEEIAAALADQTDYEHRWLIDPRTGE